MVHWIPLESNPEVMNKFLQGIGVPSSACISDVCGLDHVLLAMVPTPVYALLLLYPDTSSNAVGWKSEEFAAKQQEEVAATAHTVPEELYYMRQFVGNACGTVALMHAVANNTSKMSLADGALKSFLEKTKALNPEERGHALEEDEGISVVHEQFASEGQTEAPDREAEVEHHFVAFVNVGGSIYELDGSKMFPINHGPTTDETFLFDGAAVLKGFMERDSAETRFAVMALTAA